MSKEAMKLALEALNYVQANRECPSTTRQAIKALEEALAKQEQGEPYGYLKLNTGKFVNEVEGLNPMKDKRYLPLYDKPQQRTWVGLDPEEIRKTNHHMVDGAYHYSFKQGAEWAEAKLKEKNT